MRYAINHFIYGFHMQWFLPKVYTKASVSRPIFVPAMHSHTAVSLHKLGVRGALNTYMHRTTEVRCQSKTHLIVAYGRQDKRKPISKMWLSNWLVECI